MTKKREKVIAIFLLIAMCMGLAVTPAFARQETSIGNIWYGDELAIDVTAGTDGYTFMSLFQKPAHGYEFSGHFMGGGEGPQTFVVIDTVEHDATTWTPDGLYEFGKSNYEVVYCCDVETMIADAAYYKRMNLEDSEYYNEAQAAKIRAIVTNAYPYVSLEKMKKNLADDGFEDADKLTRNEIIAAVQCAIWACSNSMDEPLRYEKSYKVSDNFGWGYPLHDISSESGLDVSGKRVFKTYQEVGARIDGLVDYLLSQDEVYAEKNQIVVSKLEVVDAIPVQEQDGVYKVVMQVALNNSGSSELDDIYLETSVDGAVVEKREVALGTETYDFIVEAKNGQTIKTAVAGTQVLPEGVYFYAPKPADTNSDGVETSREVSQNLIGAAMGKTPVFAEKSVTLELDVPRCADLALQKIDESGEPLAGAEFSLYVKGEEAVIKVDTYSVDEEGKLKIEGLLPGEYRLKETKAPDGYARLNQAIVFTVSDDGEIVLCGNVPECVVLDNSTDNDANTLIIKNKPVVPNEGDITVEKTVTGNMAPNEPFSFKLFVKEQKVSPYADAMEAAADDLDYAIENAADGIKVTTGSAYTLDGTTLSQYVFTLNGKAAAAVTSGSAVQFHMLKDFAPGMDFSSLTEGMLEGIKEELAKAYTSFLEIMKGLYVNVNTNDEYTVMIAQEALEPIVKAGQLYNNAKDKNETWQAENATASALQITFGNKVYTTADGLQYDAENQWWELEFQVSPGENFAANIHVESTTGSIISYTISETVISNGYYIGTDVLDSAMNPVRTGASLGEWVTLTDNDYHDGYVFRNHYKTITNREDWCEKDEKDEKDEKEEKEEKDLISPVVLEEFDDPEVPLGDMEIPGEPVNPDEELEDPEIPLGDAPATGDTNNAAPFMALLFAAVAGLFIIRRKFN